jgi:hypothetical protein
MRREVHAPSGRPRRVIVGAVVEIAIMIVLASSWSLSGPVWVYFGLSATVRLWRCLSPRPRLWVDDEALTIEAPTVLSGPLRIDRDRVHSVHVLESDQAGWSWHEFWRDRRKDRDAEPTSNWAPMLGEGRHRFRLLVVLDPSLPLADVARRRTRWFTFFERSGYDGPTRWTVARGLFFPLAPADQTREAFAGWPFTDELDPELRTWVEGDRIRTRWGWEAEPWGPPSRSSLA